MSRLTAAILALAAAAVLWAFAVPGAQSQNDKAELALKAASDKEIVEGDLRAAIEQYRRILTTHRANRVVAAKALVRMGQCYEKLGDTEARKAYEQAIREYDDQKEAVATARARLAALAGKQPGRGVVARQLWAGVDRDYGASISRDGRYVAFYDREAETIHWQDLVTGETRRVGKAEGDFSPGLVSPDGEQIAYRDYGREELHVMGVDGSNPRVLAREPDARLFPHGWSPDGKHILASIGRKGEKWELVLVSVADGSLRVIGPQVHQPQFSPDGRYIAYERLGRLPPTDADIFVLRVADGRETLLVENPGPDNEPMWTPDGNHVLFISGRLGKNDLWSIRVAEGKPGGPPRLLKENLGDATAIGITREGDYYYSSFSEIKDIYVAEVDPQTGKLASPPRQLIGRFNNAGPAFSPDGQYLAYYSQRGSARWGPGALTMVLRSTKTGEERVLSPKSTLNLPFYKPQWFPDGRSLFVHLRNGQFRQIDVQSGEDRPLLASANIPSRDAFTHSTVLAPDGRAVYYLPGGAEAEPKRILRLDLETNEEKELCRLNALWLGQPSVSPDGNALAFLAFFGAGHHRALMTLPTNGGEPRELYRFKDVGVRSFAKETVWARDGSRVFFAGWNQGQGHSQEVWSIPIQGGEPTPLGIGLHRIWFLDFQPDGRQLAFVDVQERVELWALRNLLPAAK